MSPWDIVLLIAFGVMGVVALWFPFMIASTLFSGWWELAKAFPKRQIPSTATRGVGSVFFSPIFRYRGVVHWAADEDYLHLWMPVVGVFHERMSVPFAAMTFFAGEHVVMGMMAVEIDGRRLLMSKTMLRREIAVRRALGTLGPEGEANDPNGSTNPATASPAATPTPADQDGYPPDPQRRDAPSR